MGPPPTRHSEFVFPTPLLFPPAQPRCDSGSSAYRIVYPYHLSIIDPGIREGSVGGEEEMVHVSKQGCCSPRAFVKKKKLYLLPHGTDGTISPLSSFSSPPRSAANPLPFLAPSRRPPRRPRAAKFSEMDNLIIYRPPLLVPRFYRKRVEKKCPHSETFVFLFVLFLFLFHLRGVTVRGRMSVRGRGAAMRRNDERSDEARERTLAFPALCSLV